MEHLPKFRCLQNDDYAYIESKTKRYFVPERAIEVLLRDNVLFANSRHYLEGEEKQEKTLVLFVMCNDLFAWATADGESVTTDELESLYLAYKGDMKWGVDIWCCKKRKMAPQEPVIKRMKKDGVWTEELELLSKEISMATTAEEGGKMKEPEIVMINVIDYLILPEHMREGMQRYVEHGIRPGDFLYFILCNDFVYGLGHADRINTARIVDYAKFLYLEAPSGCWGSKEKVDKWIGIHEEERRRKNESTNHKP